MNTLETLFELAASRQASDIHLATGETPRLRIAGELVPLEESVDLPMLFASLLTPEASARLAAGLPVERTLLHGDLAFVAIVFRVGEDGLAATIRLILKGIPPLDLIGEDALRLLRRLVDAPRGLVLIVGRAGSGKWTTACALADAINETRAARIFVIEGHPTLRLASRKGMVTQFHVGEDCESYAKALEIAHQADLDVVAMDDIPTYEALRQALILADTGHLVIANLGAETVADAVDRLALVAGEDAPALRRALAESLVAATGQRLVPRAGGGGAGADLRMDLEHPRRARGAPRGGRPPGRPGPRPRVPHRRGGDGRPRRGGEDRAPVDRQPPHVLRLREPGMGGAPCRRPRRPTRHGPQSVGLARPGARALRTFLATQRSFGASVRRRSRAGPCARSGRPRSRRRRSPGSPGVRPAPSRAAPTR